MQTNFLISVKNTFVNATQKGAVAICFGSLFVFPLVSLGQMDKEENFYSMPKTFAITKDFVTDYKVDNDFKTDDSEKLQNAIDEVSSSKLRFIYCERQEKYNPIHLLSYSAIFL